MQEFFKQSFLKLNIEEPLMVSIKYSHLNPKRMLVLSCLLMLSACGGGGDSDERQVSQLSQPRLTAPVSAETASLNDDSDVDFAESENESDTQNDVAESSPDMKVLRIEREGFVMSSAMSDQPFDFSEDEYEGDFGGRAGSNRLAASAGAPGSCVARHVVKSKTVWHHNNLASEVRKHKFNYKKMLLADSEIHRGGLAGALMHGLVNSKPASALHTSGRMYINKKKRTITIETDHPVTYGTKNRCRVLVQRTVNIDGIKVPSYVTDSGKGALSASVAVAVRFGTQGILAAAFGYGTEGAKTAINATSGCLAASAGITTAGLLYDKNTRENWRTHVFGASTACLAGALTSGYGSKFSKWVASKGAVSETQATLLANFRSGAAFAEMEANVAEAVSEIASAEAEVNSVLSTAAIVVGEILEAAAPAVVLL